MKWNFINRTYRKEILKIVNEMKIVRDEILTMVNRGWGGLQVSK